MERVNDHLEPERELFIFKWMEGDRWAPRRHIEFSVVASEDWKPQNPSNFRMIHSIE